MRKILTLIMAFAIIVNTTNAAFTENKIEKTEHQNAISSEETRQSAEFFAKLSRQDFEKLTGKHLSLLERLSFKLSQSQLKRALKREAKTEGFNAGGFLLGFFLGIYGVLIAYLVSRDSNLHKWALIGFGVLFALGLILILFFLAIYGISNRR